MQGTRLLNVFDKFGVTNNLLVTDIQPSVLYLLSAPSTPEPARQEAIEKAESGKTVTFTDAKELVDAHKRIRHWVVDRKSIDDWYESEIY